MLPFEDLDAFKACHHLTLVVHRIADKLGDRDPDLAAQLWSAALVASGRIARGSAFSNARMFATCLDRTLSALSEISYHMELGRALNLLSEDDHREIESLRGRAVFYTMKLLTSLSSPPERGTGSSPPTG